MHMEEVVFPAITSLIVLVPNMLVLLIGIAVAALRWQRHPRVSLLAIIALLVTLLLDIGSTLFSTIVPISMMRAGESASRVGMVVGSVTVLLRLISAGCWVLLLVALFGWRDSTSARSGRVERAV
jgi:hypothetical protein